MGILLSGRALTSHVQFPGIKAMYQTKMKTNQTNNNKTKIHPLSLSLQVREKLQDLQKRQTIHLMLLERRTSKVWENVCKDQEVLLSNEKAKKRSEKQERQDSRETLILHPWHWNTFWLHFWNSQLKRTDCSSIWQRKKMFHKEESISVATECSPEISKGDIMELCLQSIEGTWWPRIFYFHYSLSHKADKLGKTISNMKQLEKCRNYELTWWSIFTAKV